MVHPKQWQKQIFWEINKKKNLSFLSVVEHTVFYVFNWFPWENIGTGYSCNILPDISKKNNDKNSYLKTFRTVCHCEAVELFAVLDDLLCFPTSAVLFWWVYNQYGQQKSLITISNVAQCPLPADGMRVMWLKKISNHTLTLTFSSVLSCLNHKSHTKYFTQLFPFSSWVGCHCDD